MVMGGGDDGKRKIVAIGGFLGYNGEERSSNSDTGQWQWWVGNGEDEGKGGGIGKDD